MIKELDMQGLYFGLTEGSITTIGIIIGMYASIPIKLAIIGSVLTASISDSFGDSIGMYYSEQARNSKKKTKDILNTIFGLVLSKVGISIIYLLPIIIFSELKYGIITSIILSLIVLTKSFIYLSKKNKKNTKKFLLKNLFLICIVIIISFIIGSLLNKFFDNVN